MSHRLRTRRRAGGVVDPYSAKVLGAATMGGGTVGLANRLHGTLNNESLTVPLLSAG